MSDSGIMFRSDEFAAQRQAEGIQAQAQATQSIVGSMHKTADVVQRGLEQRQQGQQFRESLAESRAARSFREGIDQRKMAIDEMQAPLDRAVAERQAQMHQLQAQLYTMELALRKEVFGTQILNTEALLRKLDLDMRMDAMRESTNQLRERGILNTTFDRDGETWGYGPSTSGMVQEMRLSPDEAKRRRGRQSLDDAQQQALTDQARAHADYYSAQAGEKWNETDASQGRLAGGGTTGIGLKMFDQMMRDDPGLGDVIRKAGDDPKEIGSALEWVAGLMRQASFRADPSTAKLPPSHWLEKVRERAAGNPQVLDQYLQAFRQANKQK